MFAARPDFQEDALEKRRVKEAVRARMFGAQTAPLVIGPYEIRRRIGAGAMGVVYEAWDPRLRRLVALKMLLAESDDDTRTTRLIREAQALAQLRHPNVVGVHDVGTHDGRIYVVMEMVQGVTLEEWARTTRPDVKGVLAMLVAIGQGLAAAHERGLVHRDIKPDNVLVDREGTPRVVDFGLARVAQTDLLSSLAQQIPGAALDMRLTQTGTALGTPVYMSPEQLRGAPVDARSDQYAFGVMAYHLLYGSFPYRADSIGHLIAAVTSEDLQVPSPRGEAAQVREAILRTLSKEPEKRFASMRDLLAVLARVPEPRAPAPSPARGEGRALLIGLVALAALVLVGGVGVTVGFLVARDGGAPGGPQATTAAIPVPAFDLDAAMMPSATPASTTERDAGAGAIDATPEATAPTPTPRAPERPSATPERRRAPRREIRIGSSENLWRNSDPARSAVRGLAGPVSNCFDPDWDYPRRGPTQLGVYVTIEPDGSVEDIEVEDMDYVPEPYRRCIGRVFRQRLGPLPPTARGWGGRFWYVIPFRPAD